MSVTPYSLRGECYFLTMSTIVDMPLTVFVSYDICMHHENKFSDKKNLKIDICLSIVD